MKKISIVLLGVAFILTAAMSAQAIPVTNIDGHWTLDGGTGVRETRAHPDFKILWGLACGGSLVKNGLLFSDTLSPAEIVADGDAIQFGTLTHFNKPILSSSSAHIANLVLKLTLGDTPLFLNLDFRINETLNTRNPSESADIIFLPSASGSYNFSYLETGYTFEMLGFGENAGSNLSMISTEECESTTVPLWARVTTSVPEPAPLLLIGLGLIGLAGFKRKLKR